MQLKPNVLFCVTQYPILLSVIVTLLFIIPLIRVTETSATFTTDSRSLIS